MLIRPRYLPVPNCSLKPGDLKLFGPFKHLYKNCPRSFTELDTLCVCRSVS